MLPTFPSFCPTSSPSFSGISTTEWWLEDVNMGIARMLSHPAASAVSNPSSTVGESNSL